MQTITNLITYYVQFLTINGEHIAETFVNTSTQVTGRFRAAHLMALHQASVRFNINDMHLVHELDVEGNIVNSRVFYWSPSNPYGKEVGQWKEHDCDQWGNIEF